MSDCYILDGKNPIKVTDSAVWGSWMASNSRRVASTVMAGFTISTVFLGIDHSFGNGLPILFETMVFRGDYFEEIGDIEGLEAKRYTTWVEAEQGHYASVAVLWEWLSRNNVRVIVG